MQSMIENCYLSLSEGTAAVIFTIVIAIISFYY